MTAPEEQRKWWGWGREDFSAEPAVGLLDFLEQRLSFQTTRELPVPDLDALDLRPPELPEALTADLSEAVGEENVRRDKRSRVFHAMGRGYRDLIRLRLGKIPAPPDAVVYPGDSEEAARVLAAAASHGAAVTPFGGGSSVVGGVELAAELRPNICLDMSRMNRVLEINGDNLTVRAEAGVFGPDLEDELNRAGYTLGHFPQSFHFSTLGGWIAARGAGHKSLRYGKIEDMVVSLRVVWPGSGTKTPEVPAAAAGGDLTALLVGSEGTLGVITEAVMRIRPLPEKQWFYSCLFPTFEAGLAAVRRMTAAGLRPATLRLSDPVETSALLTEAGARKTSRWGRFLFKQALPMYLGWRGIDPAKACLLLAGGEGRAAETVPESREVRRICKAHGGASAGSGPARAWDETRYTSPYMRDELITRGLLVETLETAAEWDRLHGLYGKVRSSLEEALSAQGTPGVVMTHLSHAYSDGGNLYFTFLAPQKEGREEEQWRTAKEAACETIISHGGAISHHHGVGRDHKPWLDAYWGKDLLDAFRAAKSQLDPAGVLNPGAVVDPDPRVASPVGLFPAFSIRTRQNLLREMPGYLYDLLVIGGGIVGAGTAWDASLRGLSTVLVEMGDFGSGTSGKSSRLIHGGLRYLKMLDIKLVKESLTERHNLMQMIPHLARPVQFIVPVFKGQGESRRVMNLGLWAYDTLAGKKGLPTHQSLSREELLALEPSLTDQELEGGLIYYDCMTDDARLTLETVKAAARAGAAAVNYTEVKGLEIDGQGVTARVIDHLNGGELTIRAKAAVNAAGVWSDRVRASADEESRPAIRPAKGVHIVFPRRLKPIEHVVILKAEDGRPLFAVPLGDSVYVGTTDTDYKGDLNEVHAERSEVEYLLDAVNSSFSGPPLTIGEVTSTWAGLRPLVSEDKSGDTAAVSREHEIDLEKGRLLTVRGGKLTTFRLMAAQAVDMVMEVLGEKDAPPSVTPSMRICESKPDVGRIGEDLPPKAAARIREKYGPQAEAITILARGPLLRQMIDETAGVMAAEVFWAVEAEMAATLNDLMTRRLGLTYLTPDRGLEAAPKAARLMGSLLGWSKERLEAEILAYEDLAGKELYLPDPAEGLD